MEIQRLENQAHRSHTSIPNRNLNNEDSSNGFEQQKLTSEAAEGEVEWLRQEVELLQQALLNQLQQQQEIEQELQATNQEMALVNQEIYHLRGAKQLTLDEAKAFARTLLAEEEPTREALARLLSAIYGETVAPRELGKLQSPVCRFTASAPQDPVPPSPKVSARRAEFHAQYIELGSRFITFKAQYARLKARFRSDSELKIAGPSPAAHQFTTNQSLENHIQ